MEEQSQEALSANALVAALPITAREADVLACVASGMTNLQVARNLGISVRTVMKHLQHLYPKLGVTSRVAATVRAFRVLGGGEGETVVERVAEQASTIVRSERADRRTLPDPIAFADALPITAREAEVLTCVASGMTNLEIARHLAISVRTVIKHLEHLYPKLGVTNRVAATVLAFRVLGGGESMGRHRPGIS